MQSCYSGNSCIFREPLVQESAVLEKLSFLMLFGQTYGWKEKTMNVNRKVWHISPL